jgi:hypothetical protein
MGCLLFFVVELLLRSILVYFGFGIKIHLSLDHFITSQQAKAN